MAVVSQIQLLSGVTGKLYENFYPEVLNGILMDDFSNMPTHHKVPICPANAKWA